MNKKQAKKVLVQQRRKLNGSFVLGNFDWINETSHYVEHIFTMESQPYRTLSEFRPIDPKLKDTQYPEVAANLNKIIDGWIEMIDCGAYHHPPKPNFFKHLSNEFAVALLTLIAGALFWGGREWGEYMTDQKVYNVEQEKKTLRDTINFLKLQIIKNNITLPLDTSKPKGK